MNERVKIEGFVTAWQEDEHGNREIVIPRTQNHFVDQGLRGLLSYILGSAFGAGTYKIYYAWSQSFQIYLGIDTTTSTAHNLTALINPIGTTPGTAPNITSGDGRSNPATGTWKAGWIAQWNPGTVSGTVGELALYLRPFTVITNEWFEVTPSTAYKDRLMVSRLSVADSDFSAVTIDTSKSFVAHWEIQISFA